MTWELQKGQAWALSLFQPWAWLVTRGIKDIENRPWSTTFRGRFYVHASKLGASQLDECIEQALSRLNYERQKLGLPQPHRMELPHPSTLAQGGIVGSVELVDVIPPCLRTHDPDSMVCRCNTPWHMGRQYGFRLRDPRLQTRMPLPGKQRFFRFELRNE